MLQNVMGLVSLNMASNVCSQEWELDSSVRSSQEDDGEDEAAVIQDVD